MKCLFWIFIDWIHKNIQLESKHSKTYFKFSNIKKNRKTSKKTGEKIISQNFEFC